MDPELVIRAQDGDEAAFSRLAVEMGPRFNEAAYRILRDVQLAQDVTQQAIIDVWSDLPKLRDPERFRAWSYRVLVRLCYREAKQTRRRLIGILALPAAETSSTDAIAAVADRDQLERAVRRLSVEQRAVVVFTYHLDMRPDEVAEALDIPVGTVHSRLHRALRALRASIDADARSATTDTAAGETTR